MPEVAWPRKFQRNITDKMVMIMIVFGAGCFMVGRLSSGVGVARSHTSLAAPAPSSKFAPLTNFFTATNDPVPILMLDIPEIKTQIGYISEKEPDNMKIIRHVLSEACRTSRSTFVDSGHNDGFWSLLASAHGCSVEAVDPQPLCTHWLTAAKSVNNFTRLSIHNNFLAESSFQAHVRTDECSGILQVPKPKGKESSFSFYADSESKAQSEVQTQAVSSVRLDDLVAADADVVLWHVDTEGAEIGVLKSARSLLQQRRIKNILMEWEPTRWKVFSLPVPEGLALAKHMLANYTCKHVGDGAPLSFDLSAAMVRYGASL